MENINQDMIDSYQRRKRTMGTSPFPLYAVEFYDKETIGITASRIEIDVEGVFIRFLGKCLKHHSKADKVDSPHKACKHGNTHREIFAIYRLEEIKSIQILTH